MHTNFNCKAVEITEIGKAIPRTQVARIYGDDEIKKTEKSKNVPEEKRKMVKRKICKKDLYNNFYELRSGAIKLSRTSLDVQLKKLSLTKQKRELERTMSELGKPFLRKI